MSFFSNKISLNWWDLHQNNASALQELSTWSVFCSPLLRGYHCHCQASFIVKMQFWTSCSVSLHNASFIPLEPDEIFVLSAPRSEEGINFQPPLPHLHANMRWWLAASRDCARLCPREPWGWEARRTPGLLHPQKLGSLEVSQLLCEI